MKMLEDKVHYRRNIQLGLIISLAVLLAAFFIIPHPTYKNKPPEYYAEPFITVIDIPPTVQARPAAASFPPPLPQLSLFVPAIDDPEILEDAEIKNAGNTANQYGDGNNTGGKTYEYSSLPFIPRQILEVVPEKVDGAEGFIKLQLKIGTDGLVKDYKVSENTTDKADCYQKVITAVLKSKWQPITIEGSKIEYWLEKTYRFE